MNIENVPVANIKPYERNAKKHPAEQVEHIANSIREFGFKQPLVIDKDNVLVIGHGRLLAAQKIGMDTVPCVRADDLTEEQIKALRLADNKTNESDWDTGLLDVELDDITDIDMGLFGFESSEKEEHIRPEVEFSEILGEENNYIVLQFKTDIDWLNAQSVFDIETVKCYSTRKDGVVTKTMERRGSARVLDGAKALRKILGDI